MIVRARERRSPKPAQEKRDDWNVRSFDRQLETALKLADLSVVANNAFGKKRDDFAVLKSSAYALYRRSARAARYGNNAEQLQEAAQKPFVVNALEHHELYGARAGYLQNQPVDPTNMIAKQQNAARRRDMLYALNVRLVAKSQNWKQQYPRE